MEKKKIAVILAAIVLVVGIVGLALSRSNIDSKKTRNPSYLENEDDSLTIQADAEIANPEDAYRTAILAKENFESSNKDKIQSHNIKEIHVIIKGKYISWLYDGTGSVKEIDLE